MKPKILITLGDPAGIGPEIIIKALVHHKWEELVPIVVGSRLALEKASRLLGIECTLKQKEPPFDEEKDPKEILVWDISDLTDICFGSPQDSAALEAVRYVKEAVNLLKQGSAQAMVTCPLNKMVIKATGYPFVGHTEMIAEMCGVKDYVMMLCGPLLRVSLVTTHIALRDVAPLINEERLMKTVSITRDALVEDFGLKDPKLAVAGLNPHAGEGGMFGLEEEELIKPTLSKIIERGIPVTGPLSPDTVFYRAYKGEFDAVVALYHDQGLIPLKLVHFEEGVNVTLGLPIIRTSVDHGTAYEIAGKGVASAKSLVAAIGLAYKICQNRGRIKGNGAFPYKDKGCKAAQSKEHLP